MVVESGACFRKMARTITDLMQYVREAECRSVSKHVTGGTGVGFESLGLLFVLFTSPFMSPGRVPSA
jgi:hypothetical protein